MIAKETLGMFGIIAIIGFGGYSAFTGYQQASEAKQALAESNDQLNKASNQSVRLINETGKGVVYLAPKGATASKDDDGSKLHAILEQIFRYRTLFFYIIIPISCAFPPEIELESAPAEVTCCHCC